MTTGQRTCLVGLLVLLGGAGARAADHTNLEQDLPTSVEDAYPIAHGGIELQGFGRWERTDEDEDRFTLEPRLEVGLLPNFQAAVYAPFVLGSADHTGSRNLGVEALYNFNAESLRVPAMALAAGVDFPTGRNAAGVDTRLEAIVTKTLGATSAMHRVHLNAAWIHNAGNRSDERDDRYVLVAGYSARLGPDTIFVADFVREQDRVRDANVNLLEFGLRRQLTPLSLIAIGAGPGIGEESPDVRITIAFQHELTWPWLH